MVEKPEIEWLVLRRVFLGSHHLHPGRTKHTLSDSKGKRDFAPFVSLEIVRSGQGNYYLMHVCEDGSGTDTWHQTLEEAMGQAEYEFEVKASEWVVVQEETK
jgi:hypothetical protein